jgi:transposase-like protein
MPRPDQMQHRPPVYPVVLEELLPAAWHHTDRYANNRVECDHARLKAWLRPMRGRKQDHRQGDPRRAGLGAECRAITAGG